MKIQALFSLKDESKKLKCCLLQFLIGALRVKACVSSSHGSFRLKNTDWRFKG